MDGVCIDTTVTVVTSSEDASSVTEQPDISEERLSDAGIEPSTEVVVSEYDAASAAECAEMGTERLSGTAAIEELSSGQSIRAVSIKPKPIDIHPTCN